MRTANRTTPSRVRTEEEGREGGDSAVKSSVARCEGVNKSRGSGNGDAALCQSEER